MKIKPNKNILIVFLAGCVALASCQGAESDAPAEEQSALLTAAVGTMVNAFFETQTALYTPATPTATNTFLPTITPSPFATPTQFATLTATYVYYSPTPTVAGSGTPSATPGSLGAVCNNSEFVRDVNYPAGAEVPAGSDFYKTWKVANSGSCPWMYQYSIVFVGGDPALNSGNLKIQKRVDPEQWTELTIGITAPKQPGTYTGSWRLADADGKLFGETFTITIVVK